MAKMKKPMKAAIFALCLLGAGCYCTISQSRLCAQAKKIWPKWSLALIPAIALLKHLERRPTAGGVLEGGGFYYVRSRVKHSRSKHAPTEISRELVAVTFDGNGTVANVERYRA